MGPEGLVAGVHACVHGAASFPLCPVSRALSAPPTPWPSAVTSPGLRASLQCPAVTRTNDVATQWSRRCGGPSIRGLWAALGRRESIFLLVQ